MGTSASIASKQQPLPPPAESKLSGSNTNGLRSEILDRSEYHLWDSFVERSPHGTVFHHSWWLNITAQSFDLLVARDKQGVIRGGIPLPKKRRAGLMLCHAPQLTPFLGPVFDLSSSKDCCDQLYVMRSAGEALARKMPRFDSFRCMVAASGPDLQGFLWAGFRAELAYTFRLPGNKPIDSVEAQITRTHLQKLAKAKRLEVSVTRNDDLEAFVKLSKVASRHDNRMLFPEELPLRLWSAGFKRGMSDFYIARTNDNQPIAALLTVHDERTTYQIVSAFDASKRDIPGSYLMLWTAIQDALNAKRDFDFEGSALRGVEQYYRKWGPAAVPVWRLEKAGTLRGHLLLSAARYRARAQHHTPTAN